jgi:uncharacterized protein (TIGR00730 family)
VKRIGVFCGSSSGDLPVFTETARHLGALLARRGLGLVFGGGNIGLMGELANAALAAQGEVVGVIPRALVALELAHRGVTNLCVVDSMHERKARMVDASDAFIALPGGYGTLDELCEVLTWTQLGIHAKPCGLLNLAGFYDSFLAQLDHAVARRFLRPEHRSLLIADDDAERLLDRLAALQVPSLPKWIDRDGGVRAERG